MKAFLLQNFKKRTEQQEIGKKNKKGNSAKDSGPSKSKYKKIVFDLDDRSPRENNI